VKNINLSSGGGHKQLRHTSTLDIITPRSEQRDLAGLAAAQAGFDRLMPGAPIDARLVI
jgi:hypothetical protein